MGSHRSAPRAGNAAGATGRGTDDVRGVMDSLRRIVRTLRLASVASDRALGVTAAQLFVLQLLAEAQPCSVGELAKRTLTHQSSVSVVVSKLEAQGLAARRPSRTDARRVEVSLTAAGRALLRRAPQAAQFRIVEGVAKLPAAQRRQLARALQALVELMGAAGQEPGLLFEDEQPQRGRRPATAPRGAAAARPARAARPAARRTGSRHA